MFASEWFSHGSDESLALSRRKYNHLVGIAVLSTPLHALHAERSRFASLSCDQAESHSGVRLIAPVNRRCRTPGHGYFLFEH